MDCWPVMASRSDLEIELDGRSPLLTGWKGKVTQGSGSEIFLYSAITRKIYLLDQ